MDGIPLLLLALGLILLSDLVAFGLLLPSLLLPSSSSPPLPLGFAMAVAPYGLLNHLSGSI